MRQVMSVVFFMAAAMFALLAVLALNNATGAYTWSIPFAALFLVGGAGCAVAGLRTRPISS